MSTHAFPDRYLPETARTFIEQTYYARINNQASLERLIHDPDIRQNPSRHVGLFADHGVVHVRDIARRIIQVLDLIHGRLIPTRPASRFEFFMKGYGVVVAYLHDIGMVDFSAVGRATHPEFAAQAVFRPEFDALVDLLWRENWGNLAWCLLRLADAGALTQDPRLVMREMLSMSVCHSKSKVPVAVLNDPQRLRQVMQASVGTDLDDLYRDQEREKARQRRVPAEAWAQTTGSRQLSPAAERAPAASARAHLQRYYTDFPRESFRWLVSDHEAVRDLVDDVVDTLRALRCADALRQRGTVLKTSGGYEVFIDQMTADAIFALRQGTDQLFLVSDPDLMRSGEANLASSELDRDGNLRVAFHRGAFPDAGTVRKAAYSAAVVVNDIQADIVESFSGRRAADDRGHTRPHHATLILIEGVDDNLAFADLVAEQLLERNPTLQPRVRTVPSLQHLPDPERHRYLNATDCTASAVDRRAILDQVGRAGHKVTGIDPNSAFNHVRLVALQGGETLIEAGWPPGFVYIPLEEGLTVLPLGGYQPFSVKPWMPLGNTGVIRGAVRNATVVANQPVRLLAIPKEVYLRHWHTTYSIGEFLQRLSAG